MFCPQHHGAQPLHVRTHANTHTLLCFSSSCSEIPTSTSTVEAGRDVAKPQVLVAPAHLAEVKQPLPGAVQFYSVPPSPSSSRCGGKRGVPRARERGPGVVLSSGWATVSTAVAASDQGDCRVLSHGGSATLRPLLPGTSGRTRPPQLSLAPQSTVVWLQLPLAPQLISPFAHLLRLGGDCPWPAHPASPSALSTPPAAAPVMGAGGEGRGPLD